LIIGAGFFVAAAAGLSSLFAHDDLHFAVLPCTNEAYSNILQWLNIIFVFKYIYSNK